jgi:hypothetical protein
MNSLVRRGRDKEILQRLSIVSARDNWRGAALLSALLSLTVIHILTLALLDGELVQDGLISFGG